MEQPDFFLVYGVNRLGDWVLCYICTTEDQAKERQEECCKKFTNGHIWKSFIITPFYNGDFH